MVDEKIENIFLVNAPAGSGKTTKIKALIEEHRQKYSKNNILCITFTNRAADELSNKIMDNKVFVGTIHNFINNFISILFKKKEIIDLYFECYEQKILEEIASSKNKKKNDKYIQKYGCLKLKIIKENLKKLYYNELQYSSFYYGGLSHDELLKFARKILERFPKIKKRLSQKYQLIFIDEYQDTSAEVLKLFYGAVLNTKTKLYLFGDKMQQIYKNYDGSFEKYLVKLNRKEQLRTNYRSVPIIINLLNNIYNDKNEIQVPGGKYKNKKPDFNPRIIICKNIKDELKKEKSKENLFLYLLNREKFKEIGSEKLYSEYSKLYKFGNKYNAADILTNKDNDNPDSIIKILYIIDEIKRFWEDKKYGNIISTCKKNKKIFHFEIYTLIKHEQKSIIRNKWEKVFKIYENKKSKIFEIINLLKEEKIVNYKYIDEIFGNKDYENVIEIEIEEITKLCSYLEKLNISTQHGVKGESHDCVVFVAEDSSNLKVKMYEFFKLWSDTDISLNILEEFYFSFRKIIEKIEEKIGIKISYITSDVLKENKTFIEEKIKQIVDKFSNNDLFKKLYYEEINVFLEKETVTSFKKGLNINIIYGILSAYRLFYVGCSRARKNLKILVNENKISEFRGNFIKKMEELGFEIENKDIKEDKK